MHTQSDPVIKEKLDNMKAKFLPPVCQHSDARCDVMRCDVMRDVMCCDVMCCDVI